MMKWSKHPVVRDAFRVLRGSLLGLTLLLAAGCGKPSEEAHNTSELLLVYSGDFKGFYEPCG